MSCRTGVNFLMSIHPDGSDFRLERANLRPNRAYPEVDFGLERADFLA